MNRSLNRRNITHCHYQRTCSELTRRQFCRQLDSHLFIYVEIATHVDVLSSALGYSYLLTYLLTIEDSEN